uniref:Testis development related protein n=1 Tax=Equus caballus TaxID=9796 RepID=A0A9L0R917_HORSE
SFHTWQTCGTKECLYPGGCSQAAFRLWVLVASTGHVWLKRCLVTPETTWIFSTGDGLSVCVLIPGVWRSPGSTALSACSLERPRFLPPLVQGASFRGWKEVTSLFNKDDEQRLLESCESPRSKGTNLRLKEELKTEKKSGFWDNLALKQNIQSKKPDEIEGWEPPKLALEDVAADSNDALNDHASRPGWEEDPKGSTKYTSLASSGNSSRWSLRSAGKLVSIRRQSKGHLTDHWEELE